jgi:hypothetical protein
VLARALLFGLAPALAGFFNRHFHKHSVSSLHLEHLVTAHTALNHRPSITSSDCCDKRTVPSNEHTLESNRKHSYTRAIATRHTITMKFFQQTVEFDYSWEEVSTSNWRKYGPWNEKTPHVIAVDTLSRTVDPVTGIVSLDPSHMPDATINPFLSLSLRRGRHHEEGNANSH